MYKQELGNNYLKLIIGPMFSSKSSSLLSEINRYKYIVPNILVINNSLDKKRYSESNNDFLKTHNNESFPAVMLENLSDLKSKPILLEKYLISDVIIIDEAQFFKDLYVFIKNELNNTYQSKVFIIAGLSSDYKMEPIGDIIKLIPMADSIEKLSAICIYCKDGTPANFTKLIKKKENNKQIIIGGKETFVPTCRKHFLI